MDLEQLVGESREREPEPLAPRERLVVGMSAIALVLATAGLAAIIPAERNSEPLIVALLTILFAVACRVEFEIGRIHAVPTQLVLVPVLPGAVADRPAAGRGRLPPRR